MLPEKLYIDRIKRYYNNEYDDIIDEILKDEPFPIKSFEGLEYPDFGIELLKYRNELEQKINNKIRKKKLIKIQKEIKV